LIADAETPSNTFHANETPSPGAQRPATSGDRHGAQPILSAAPDAHALFLDVDGTLLTIAPHPDAVKVSDDLLCLLAHLNERIGGAIALISGRAIANLDVLLAAL